jgi:hypothetical protein
MNKIRISSISLLRCSTTPSSFNDLFQKMECDSCNLILATKSVFSGIKGTENEEFQVDY